MKQKKSKNIETEVRSFISPLQYKKLNSFFKKSAKFLGQENQETHYFSGPNDLRIQKTNNTAKLWLKGGKLHQKSREDIVVRCQKDDFENLEILLLRLGYKPEIKWFRKRNNFLWQGITVSLDFTRGYGYIIELEKMGDLKSSGKNYNLLLAKLGELGVKLTPKAEFDRKFAYYKKNWKKLV
jgi:predicted adenylyl cyclase CyaB